MKKYTADSDFTKGLAILKFSADWCAPCKALKPVLDEILATRDDVTALEVDVDEYLDISERYGIRSVPHVIFFNNGVPVDQIIGLRAKEAYTEKLNLVASQSPTKATLD